MEIFLGIEGRAGLLPDSADKLRYIRSALKRRQAKRASVRARVALCLAAAAFLVLHTVTPGAHPRVATSASVSTPAKPFATTLPARVWAVETHGTYEAYSNGLQIRTDFLTHAQPRHYSIYARGSLSRSDERTKPVGIVYHTTESLLLPLAEGQRADLLLTRENLLSFISRNHLYNFVIDRFGQVFRIIPEDEVAFHAGNSIWADSAGIYAGLNDSFIGVSFEAKTAESIVPTPAQIRSGRMLTEYLRAEYAIPEADCVTHAQVSVSPVSMGIGYHTDWATNFPFRDMGLPPGYALPIAAIELFGFEYDQKFLDAIGGRPWEGITAAEASLHRNALSVGMLPRAYRTHLQAQYRQLRTHIHDQNTNTPRT